MDFKDASARFKKKKETQDGDEPQKRGAPDFAESYRIRGKMVGLLIHDARLNAARSIEDCANLLRVSANEVEAWEFGDRVPSLPQLEILAYYLGVPVSHFWGMDTLEASHGKHIDAQTEYIALRDRMIGALMRLAREDAGMTVEAVSEFSGLPVEQIHSYEMGEQAMPMHELTVLASAVRKNINYFLETSDHVGHWLAVREEWKHFSALPEDLRQFAANPLNVGFIEIAILLSQMPTEKLRRVGESVLNITM